jgi:cysteinyl-tRNA synthetase
VSQAIVEALGNDLNTPEALRIIDEAFSNITEVSLGKISRYSLLQLLETIDATLGLQLINSTPDISDDAKRTILERQQARDLKDWKKSDNMRNELDKESIVVRDGSNGSIWEYKN